MDDGMLATMLVQEHQCVVRPIHLATDTISELTALLHRAYRQLANMGMRYVASWQDDTITLERISSGSCLIALIDARMVGTITFYDADHTAGSPWYDRPEVGHFGQFAVDPGLQRHGLGNLLLTLVEQMAAHTPLQELALDTSEQATHLIDYYQRRGYRFIEHAQWRRTNYRSVIMSKTVHHPNEQVNERVEATR